MDTQKDNKWAKRKAMQSRAKKENDQTTTIGKLNLTGLTI